MSSKYKNIEIEEFDESDLFGEELTEKQIKKTKKTMMKMVKEVNEVNKELNINMTLGEILKIKNELGEESEKIEYGVRHAKILKKIVLDAIEKDIKSKNLDIVDELFVPTFIAMPGRVDNVMMHDSSYFYKFYLTKDSLIRYNLNDRYKLIGCSTFKLSDIHSLGKGLREKSWFEKRGRDLGSYEAYTSFIEPKNKKTIFINHHDKAYEKDVFNFLDRISELTGLKCNENMRYSMTGKGVIIEYIFSIAFMILFFGFFILAQI